MAKKKTHSINFIASGKNAKTSDIIAKWHFAGKIPSPGTPERATNDALQETIRWALDFKDYHTAIAKLLAAGFIDEDDLDHPTTIAYKRNIRNKADFVPEYLTEDEWKAFRKTKPSIDRIASGVNTLVRDLYKIVANEELV